MCNKKKNNALENCTRICLMRRLLLEDTDLYAGGIRSLITFTDCQTRLIS